MHVTLNMFTWVSFSRTFFCPLILCSSSLCCLGALHRKQNKYCCSVTKSCPALCRSMDCSTPVSTVLHYLPEFAQIHVCWVGDAVQPSRPLLLSSSFALDLSQHQSFPGNRLFASGGQSIGALASVLPMNIQDWFSLGLTGLISLLSKRLSRVFSNITLWKHPFFGTQPFYSPNSHDCWKNHSFDYIDLCRQSDVSAFENTVRLVIAFLPRSKHLLISWCSHHYDTVN